MSCIAMTGAAAEEVAPSPVVQPAPAAETTDCARLDALNTRSRSAEVQMPVCQTMLSDIGGWRTWLADRGIGFQASALAGVNYDVLGHARTPQLYGGQSPTYNTSSYALFTYDLTRLGMPGDAQLTVKADWYTNSYFPSIRYSGFTAVAINQRFLNGDVELQYGYFDLSHSFYGTVLGGNPAVASFGPQSNVLYSAGISSESPTPAAQIILRDPATQHFYNNFIVSRSTSPDGQLVENRANPVGLRFSIPGDGALFVDEVGYKRDASVSSRSLWVRGGAVINTSDYPALDKTRSQTSSLHNRAFYGAATAQLTSPYSDARGLYVDAKVDYSPSDVALFAHDYSLTAFILGPFSTRRKDMVSLSWSQSFFSPEERRTLQARGADSAHSTSSLEISYALNLARGVYLISSLTRTWNPVFAPLQPPALFVNESVSVTF
ncbi:Carbohydrate-selective porin OprB [Paraburkholderia xenovorans LB400]|uniref:Carbohydrate-selective porin OprB n=2 Tax=Paraburkholderia xenovorans TaxID=36873 RepID=Q13H88_PARXL|nr:Carbohydrate-selective porin OprB [Paraburkholderia xenovorans LB400]